jgi:transposase
METLNMSVKERRRLELMARVRDQQLTVAKASRLLGLSVRQGWRLWKRYAEQGDAGLVHGLRGKGSNRAISASVREAVLRLYRQKYDDFGPTLACEQLEKDGHQVGVKTLWRWLLKEGLWTRCRRRKAHRARRQRRECLGELVQMDGSHHDWFEGRGAWCVLMVMIDDATGRTLARFFEGETTVAAMEVFGAYVRKHGLPHSLYVDRDSIYRSDRQATVEEELRGQGPATQFGRAMRQLDVELILANSPQAKGRVERMNGTLQDRLVKEMRLGEISDIASGNAFLTQRFLPALNRKFMVKARAAADVHRKLPAGLKLDEVLCFQEKRRVSNDWCVNWRNRIFQLDRCHERMALAGRDCVVREKLDGTIQLLHQGHTLRWRELSERPSRAKPKATVRNSRPWKPPAEHPWRGVPRVTLAPAAPTRELHAEKKVG